MIQMCQPEETPHTNIWPFTSPETFPMCCKVRVLSPLKTIRKFKQLMSAFCLTIKEQTY